MRTAVKKELADHLTAGYCVLDVKCAAVDADAADGLDREAAPAAAAPRTALASPNLSRFLPLCHPVSKQPVVSLPTQRRFGRRKRFVWLKRVVSAERVPLMLALTGIAASAFLAMLLSMFESRVSAALSVRDDGRTAEGSGGEARVAFVPGEMRDGRAEKIVSAPGHQTTAIRALKPVVVALPAAVGLSVFFASLLLRIARGSRPASGGVSVERNGRAEAAARNAPTSVQSAKDRRRPPAPPEQSQMRRAA